MVGKESVAASMGGVATPRCPGAQEPAGRKQGGTVEEQGIPTGSESNREMLRRRPRPMPASPDHELQQALPVGKGQVLHQRADVLKEGISARQQGAQGRAALVQELQDGVKQERQDIETQQRLRQVLPTMSKVVFEVVALGLEGIEVFIFDFPPTAPRLHQ